MSSYFPLHLLRHSRPFNAVCKHEGQSQKIERHEEKGVVRCATLMVLHIPVLVARCRGGADRFDDVCIYSCQVLLVGSDGVL